MLVTNPFDLSGKVAVVTGGGGVLCGTIATALASYGAGIAVVDLRQDAARNVADKIKASGGNAEGFQANVLDKTSLEKLAEDVIGRFGRVDILLNGAGGAVKSATTSPELSFFDLSEDGVRAAFDLNFLGTFLPSQVFARYMVEKKCGSIVNIASMSGIRPLTRQVVYSAAKSAVINFTQWLSVHIGQEYGACIRVNAIAPGFFLTDQNRFLLTDEKTGELTDRGRQIIAHTPSGRFGTPEDLIGPVLMLLSDTASFVNGAVIAVDGGFSAFGGV